MSEIAIAFVFLFILLVFFLIVKKFLLKKKERDIFEEIDKIKNNIENFKINIDNFKDNVTEKFSNTSKEISINLSTALVKVNEKVLNFNNQIQTLNKSQQDIGKILSGVKQYGTLAEFSLGSLISDLLPASQYIENYKPNYETNDIVEFGIKLQNGVVCCVDSHWPIEKYKSIDEAFRNNDKQALVIAKSELAKAFKKKAADVSSKYIFPPKTTDFAIVYAPTEGLFSELAKYQDPSTKELLTQELMKKYKVTLMGPNNLSAYLQALHMGFQTLKVQKNATEVYEALKQITNRFNLHFDNIAKLRKKLEEAMLQTDSFGRDARSIKRTLENIKDPEIANNNSNIKKLEIKSI